MQHDKILKMNDGTEIKVTASIYVDGMRHEFHYNHCVTVKEKGTRKFKDVDDLRYEELIKWGLSNLIASAKLELWEKLKP